MRRRPKYQLPHQRSSLVHGLYWVLALALIGAIAWVWWRTSESPRPVPAGPMPARPVVPRAPASPAPVRSGPTPTPPPAPATNRAATPPPVPPPAFSYPLPPTAPPPVANSVPAATAITIPPVPPPVVSTAPPAFPTNGPPVTPPPPPDTWPRPVQNAFEAQVALLAHGISSGSLDGAPGAQTRAALLAFQKQQLLPATGELDPATAGRLLLPQSPLVTYTITSNDLARLHPLPHSWLAKSRQSSLEYESLLELVAEKSFAHPRLIRRLNPGLDWGAVRAGARLQLPNSVYPEPRAKAALIRIQLADKTLEAFDAGGRLLVHFPCSIAHRVEKRPVGDLHVAGVALRPTYTFDPAVFPESEEARKINHRLILPPGPNNPVGVAWIGLDRPGYGIHGTPAPEDVGRTESHGCFRLANWNAAYLARLVSVGTPVRVTE